MGFSERPGASGVLDRAVACTRSYDDFQRWNRATSDCLSNLLPDHLTALGA